MGGVNAGVHCCGKAHGRGGKQAEECKIKSGRKTRALAKARGVDVEVWGKPELEGL